MLASGIPIDVVSAGQEPMAVADLPLFTELSYRSKYVKYAQQIHTQAPLDALVRQRHSKVWDEWLPVYLIAPELFETETVSDGLRAVQVADVQQAGRVWLDLLNEQRNNDNRVFAYFPEDTALFLPDIRSYMAFMLDHYGKSEFRAGVIANELHGHLGIYAIVGVKMGLRAREYFNVGVDDIRVVSYAGSKPPVSCMNDGLQVGTGGTLGHGLIRLAEEAEARPQADFSFKNRSIRLTLKPEYAQRIAGDVRQAVADYGNLTEPYWDRIRELAVRYWAEFDRHELFILSEIP